MYITLGTYQLVILAVLMITSVIILFYTNKYLDEFTRTKAIACTLFKLSKEITIDNHKEVKKIIKYLDKITDFSMDFPSEDLFKAQNKKQINFYENLESLPSRLQYLFENDNLSEVKIDLENLSFYIFRDDKKLIDELDKFKEYPEYKSNKSFIKTLKRLVKKKWALMTLWIVLLGIASIICYAYIGIDKNSVFLGFVALLVGIAYIIFKK